MVGHRTPGLARGCVIARLQRLDLGSLLMYVHKKIHLIYGCLNN